MVLKQIYIFFALVIFLTCPLMQAGQNSFIGGTQQDIVVLQKRIRAKIKDLEQNFGDTCHANLKDSANGLNNAAKLLGGKKVLEWYESMRINARLTIDEQELKSLIESLGYYLLNHAIFDIKEQASKERDDSSKAKQNAAQILAQLYNFEVDQSTAFEAPDNNGKGSTHILTIKNGVFREQLTYLALMVIEINKQSLSLSDRKKSMIAVVAKICGKMIELDQSLGGHHVVLIKQLESFLQLNFPQRDFGRSFVASAFDSLCRAVDVTSPSWWFGWGKFWAKKSWWAAKKMTIPLLILAAIGYGAHRLAPERIAAAGQFIINHICARVHPHHTPDEARAGLNGQVTLGLKVAGLITPAQNAQDHLVGRVLVAQPGLTQAAALSINQILGGTRYGLGPTAGALDASGLDFFGGILRTFEGITGLVHGTLDASLRLLPPQDFQQFAHAGAQRDNETPVQYRARLTEEFKARLTVVFRSLGIIQAGQVCTDHRLGALAVGNPDLVNRLLRAGAQGPQNVRRGLADVVVAAEAAGLQPVADTVNVLQGLTGLAHSAASLALVPQNVEQFRHVDARRDNETVEQHRDRLTQEFRDQLTSVFRANRLIQADQVCTDHRFGAFLVANPLLMQSFLHFGGQLTRTGFNAMVRVAEAAQLHPVADGLRVAQGVTGLAHTAASFALVPRNGEQLAHVVQNYAAPYAAASVGLVALGLANGLASTGVVAPYQALETGAVLGLNVLYPLLVGAISVAGVGASGITQGAHQILPAAFNAQVRNFGQRCGIRGLSVEQSVINAVVALGLTAWVSSGNLPLAQFLMLMTMGVLKGFMQNGIQRLALGNHVQGQNIVAVD